MLRLTFLCVAIAATSVLGETILVQTHAELGRAMETVQPGDVIQIPDNVTIESLTTFSTRRSGQLGRPITVRGLGQNSILKRLKEAQAWVPYFFVSHSYWTFENFQLEMLGGSYPYGIEIYPASEATIVRNMVFKLSEDNDTVALGIRSFSKSLVVDNCTFYSHNVSTTSIEAVTRLPNPSTDRLVTITNNRFIAMSPMAGIPVRVFTQTYMIEGNNFSVSVPGYSWVSYVMVQDSVGFIRNNVGAKVRDEGFLIFEHRGEIANQRHLFDGNHCNLQNPNAYCIDVSSALYNNVTILDNNSYENGRGLTNKV